MTRKIIHIDMDCFYAAVEIRDNPSLKGKPVAVGGRPEGRGVLTTASYEARKYGIRSAMPTSHAIRLCPDLILIPPHFEKYKTESRKIREIFLSVTDKIEPLSLDEAYLDVSDCRQFEGSATKIAQEIRRQIFDETKLTASAGIAPNKFLAKVASDWKKPNGQFTVSPDKIEEFVRNLSVNKIPGVGKVTAQKMRELGVITCADLQKWSVGQLTNYFGVWGYKLHDMCRGIDKRSVSNDGERKSLSVENTYARDLKTVGECKERVSELFGEFQRRIEKAQVSEKIKSLVVKVKFHDFKQTTLERSESKNPTLQVFCQMIEEAYRRGNKPVRLLGIGVKLVVGEKRQTENSQLGLF